MRTVIWLPKRLPLLGVLLAVFVAALDLTVISTLLPGMIVDLGITITELDRAAWIVTAYLLAYTLAIPLLGRLSDRFGRTSILLAALLLFAVGSLWCAMAEGLVGLIAGRVIQALGGGAMVPVTMALLADRLPVGQRAGALGLVAAVDTAGWVAGPLYGAAVVGLLGSWHWVFWVNLPLVLATALALGLEARSGGQAAADGASAATGRGWLGWGMLKLALLAGRWRRSGGSGLSRWLEGVSGIDWAGAGLLTLALLGINLGLSVGGEGLAGGAGLAADAANDQPLAAWRWPLLLGGLLALVGFVAVERRAARPLVPIELWRRRPFAAASLINLLLGATLIIAMVNVPVFVNTLAPDLMTAQWQSAILLTPLTGGLALGSLVGGWLAGRWGLRLVALLGLLLAALGFGLIGGWPARLDLVSMAPPLGVLGLGFGLVMAPAAGAAIDSAGDRDYGIASALVLVWRLTGMAAGLSALTAWALSQLSQRLAALPPPLLSGEAGATARLAAELARRAVEVGTRVLGDTFWIAGGLCLLALLPTLWLAGHVAGDAPANQPGDRRH
jgi:MFS family permease